MHYLTITLKSTNNTIINVLIKNKLRIETEPRALVIRFNAILHTLKVFVNFKRDFYV